MAAEELNLHSAYRPRDPKKTDHYQIIHKNYQKTLHQKLLAGVELPLHIKGEFDKFMTCGIHAFGFARFNCGLCQKDKLVAYSCKRRTICPSCSGRRMADTAKHLVENVIPSVPTRQWVLSLPYKHRFLLSTHPKILSRVIGIYHRAISTFYKKQAKLSGLVNPQAGAVSVIQRFGGALNLNVHFHSIFMDGVYFENKNGVSEFYEIIPDDEDIKRLVQSIETRINRSLIKAGLLYDEFEELGVEGLNEPDQISLIKSQSIQNRDELFQRPVAIGKREGSKFVEYKSRRCATFQGFSLHANVKILSNQRSSLERLCRYISRGPISSQRVSLANNGNVILRLKTPYADGTSHFIFTPEQYIKRLIGLIPAPRQNMIRYYGVFGARHRNRKEIVARVPKGKSEKKKVKVYRTPWADLLRRVFEYEVSYCEYCGGKLKHIASITSYKAIDKILNHVNISTQRINPISPRPPPENLFSNQYIEDDFNQELHW